MSTAVATSSLSLYLSEQILYVFIGGLSVFQNGTFKTESFACKGVIQVSFHLVVPNAYDACHKGIAIIVAQGDDSIRIDMLAVEDAINAKDCLVQTDDTCLYILAKGLFRSQHKVEFRFGSKIHEVFLKCRHGIVETRDKGERIICCRFFKRCAGSVVSIIKLIVCRDVFVHFLFHDSV